MTAKSKHREGVFDLARDHLGMVRCAVRSSECRGRLESCHVIACQTLREAQRGAKLSRHRFAPDNPRLNLLNVSLDSLWADPRNGIVLCHEHHCELDGLRATRLHVDLPARVYEFAAEYGLLHMLEQEAAA